MSAETIKTPLPIGHSFFDRVIEGGYYYVDKTLFIKDLLDKNAQVTLCTRPRRFGKTLNQTMLKCFFEDTAPFGGKDTRALFNGLKIESAGERYLQHQGKYPVIFLSFKEAKRASFEESYAQLKNNIINEFKRHNYIAEKISDSGNRILFEKITNGDGSPSNYSDSLAFLSQCLADYSDRKPIILIDEYDVPLENAWFRG
ncbi:MAG: AAA family ATPase, partial [Chitinispirillales bacterium]|nr:AAA family ATPase [Chitinispirillales bacterium]